MWSKVLPALKQEKDYVSPPGSVDLDNAHMNKLRARCSETRSVASSDEMSSWAAREVQNLLIVSNTVVRPALSYRKSLLFLEWRSN